MKRIAATRQDRFLFKRRLISVAVMSAVSGHAGANPTGPQVVNGQASFATQAGTLTVTNSPNAIVNWQSFSIGSNETTRFVQQSAASAVLNRVVGVDPSAILGTLQSNGKVFLINPNGILFGQGARIDVAGLVASTLNLNDADFLAGRLNFESSPLNSSVVNRGTIVTPEGGSVFLVGAAVENSGIIHAPGGQVILAAGQTVRLGSTGAPNVLVEVEAPANRAVNLGELAVGAGKAGIYGGFVEQKGIVSANTATVNAAGKIVFKATRDTTLAATSVTSANGGKGGTISVESGGTSFIEGVVSATGASGKGGSIDLLGKQVGVIGGASVDASGAAGGGTIRVGGDYKGGNPEVANARATFLGADTRLRADATGAGDGGRIIVWSDEVTRAYGEISVRGGAAGGNGGFVETSSRGFLDVLNAPDLSAPLGRGGTWLLDPINVAIDATSDQNITNTGSGSVFDYQPTGSPSVVTVTTLLDALASGGSVTVRTSGGGGSDPGDITVNAPIVTNQATPAYLTLVADHDITATADILLGANVGLSLQAGHNVSVASLGGSYVQVNATGGIVVGAVNAAGTSGSVSMTAGAGLQTGDITSGGQVSLTSFGGAVIVPNVSTTGGSISMNSFSDLTVSGMFSTPYGVTLQVTKPGGVLTTLPGSVISGNTSGGGYSATLTADDMVLGGTLDMGANGGVQLKPYSSGRDIYVGTGTVAGALNLSPAELASVTAASLSIGNSNAFSAYGHSDLTVAGPIATDDIRAATLYLYGNAVAINADVAVDAALDLSAGKSLSAGNLSSAGYLTLRGGSVTTGDLSGSYVSVTTTGREILTGAVNASTNGGVSLSAVGDLQSGVVTSAGAVSLTSTAGGVIVSDISATGGSIHIGSFADLTVPGTLSAANEVTLTVSKPGGVLTTLPGSAIASGGATFTADDMVLSGTLDVGASGSVLLKPHSNGRDVFIGTGAGAGALNLSPAELASVTAGTLSIGNNAYYAPPYGDLTVGSPLVAGDIHAAALNLFGKVVAINADVAVDANLFVFAGTSLTAGNLSSASNLSLATAGNLTTGNLSGSYVTVGQVSGRILTGTVSASGGVSMYATGDLQAGDITSAANVSLTSTAGAVIVPDISTTGGSITIDSFADLTVPGTLSAVNEVKLTVSKPGGVLTTLPGAAIASSNATFTADDMVLGGTLDVGAGGSVLLKPYSNGRNVYLGTGAAAGALNLGPAELASVTAGTLTIGNSFLVYGDLTVGSPLAAGDIQAGTLILYGNAVAINADVAIDADLNVTAGKSLSAGNLGSAGNLNLSATGSVTTGNLSGSYVSVNAAAGGIVTGTVSANGSSGVSMTARADLQAGDITSVGPVSLTSSAGTVIVPDISTTEGSINIVSFSDLTISGALSSAYGVSLEVTRPGGVLTTLPGSVVAGNTVGSSSTGTFTADDMVLGGMLDMGASGTVELRPHSSGRDVYVSTGTPDAEGLMLTPTELASVTANTLRIGIQAGAYGYSDLTVASPIAASDIQAGTLILYGNVVAINANVTTDAQLSVYAGRSLSAGNLSSTDYLFLSASGSVTTGDLSGSYVNVSATGGAIVAGLVSAGSSSGVSMNASGDLQVAAITSTGSVSLTSSGGAVIVPGVTTTGGAINIVSFSDLAVSGTLSSAYGIDLNVTRPGGVLTTLPGAVIAGNTLGLSSSATLAADDMVLGGTLDMSANGTMQLRPYSNGRDVYVGAGTMAGALNLSPAELASVTAGTLTVGGNPAGSVIVATPIAATDINATTLGLSGNNIALGAGIAVSGNLTLNATNNIDANTTASPIDLSAGGTLTLAANSGRILRSGTGVTNVSAGSTNIYALLGADLNDIAAPDVDITVPSGDYMLATLSGTTVTLNVASGAIVDANGTANNIIATTLNISAATGIGSGDAIETAVSVLNASSGGSGSIEINNTGDLTASVTHTGSGGLVLQTGGHLVASSISVPSGNITLGAQGRLTVSTAVATSESIGLSAAGSIATAGLSGSYVNVSATGGGILTGTVSASGSSGLSMSATGDLQAGDITSAGPVFLTSSLGAVIVPDISTTGGFITIDSFSGLTVQGALAGASGVTLQVKKPGGVLTMLPGSAVSASSATLTADDMVLGGALDMGAGGTAQLEPYWSGREIYLGTGAAAGALNLDPTELASVTAGTLTIGNSSGYYYGPSYGELTVGSSLAAGDIQAGTLNLYGNAVAINAEVAIDANLNVNALGKNLSAGDLSSAGTVYLSAAGTVTTGSLSGSYVSVTATDGAIVTGPVSASGSSGVYMSSRGELQAGEITSAGTVSLISRAGAVVVPNIGTTGASITVDSLSELTVAGTLAGASGVTLQVRKPGGMLVMLPGSAVSSSSATFTADDMVLAGTLNPGASSSVQLKPYSNGRDVYVGTGAVAGALNLSPAELASVTAGTLIIGDSSSYYYSPWYGDLTVGSPLAAGDIQAGTLNLYGNAVAINAELAIDANLNVHAGKSLSAGNLSSSGNLNLSASGGVSTANLGGSSVSVTVTAAGGGVVAGTVSASGSSGVSMTAAGDLQAGSITSAGSVALTSTAGAVIVPDISTTASSIDIDSFSDLTVPGTLASVSRVALQVRKPGGVLTTLPGSAVSSSSAIFTADDMVLGGTLDMGATGSVQLQPYADARTVHVGTGAVAGALNLTPAELANATAGTLTIGSSSCYDCSTSGDLTVGSPLAAGDIHAGTLSLYGNAVAINADVAIDANLNVYAGRLSAGDLSSAGNLYLNASGSVSTGDLNGGYVSVSAGAGVFTGTVSADSVSMGAIGDLQPGDLSAGSVVLASSAATVIVPNIETTDGSIDISSFADLTVPGTLTSAYGVFLEVKKPGGVLTTLPGSVISGNTLGSASYSANLTADDLVLGGTLDMGANGTVQLRPYSNGRDVYVSTGTVAGALNLTPTELASVTVGTLDVGSSDHFSDLTVGTPIAAGDIHAGTLNLRGNVVAINADVAIDADLNVNAAKSLVAGNLSAGELHLTGGRLTTGNLIGRYVYIVAADEGIVTGAVSAGSSGVYMTARGDLQPGDVASSGLVTLISSAGAVSVPSIAALNAGISADAFSALMVQGTLDTPYGIALRVTGPGGVLTTLPGSEISGATGGYFYLTALTADNIVLGGTLNVASGATVQLRPNSADAGSFTNTSSGVIAGAGAIDLGQGTLINDGTISPGSAGTPIAELGIWGNLVQGATGALVIDVAGDAAGQYDSIAVTGSAQLGGTLTAILAGAFIPNGTQSYQILTASAGVSGDFASVGLPAGFTHQVTLVDVWLDSVVSYGTIFWDNSAGDGLWTNPLNWNLDVLPGLSDTVLVDVGGGTIVVLSGGAQTIAGLLAEEELRITGGSLTVGGVSTFNGGLTVAGGTFTASGAMSANAVQVSSGSLNVLSTAVINALSMTGGQILGAGALTVDGQLNASGGQITLGGTLRLVQAAGDLNVPIPVSTSDLDLQAAGSVTLSNTANQIALVRGSVGGDLDITSFAPLQLGAGGSMSVGGNLRAVSIAGSDLPDSICLVDSCIRVHAAVSAGGSISLYADDLYIAPASDTLPGTLHTGLADPEVNFVQWAPYTAGTAIAIDDLADIGSVVQSPRLIIGDPLNPGAIGTLDWTAVISTAAELGPIQRFEAYATTINFDGRFGEFSTNSYLPASVRLSALHGVNVGTADYATIMLGDGRSLQLQAGLSAITGDLTIGGGPGLTVRVGETDANTGSMELSGANITVTAPSGSSGTEVQVLGQGVQTITTPGDLTITSSGGGSVWLAGGGGGQSISAATMTVSSAAASPGGTIAVGTENGGVQVLDLTGNLLIESGTGLSASPSHVDVYSTGAQDITANAISILAGGGDSRAGLYVGPTGGDQTIHTTGPGIAGWGVRLVNVGSSEFAYITNDAASKLQSLTVENSGGVVLGGGSVGATSIHAAGAQSIMIKGATSTNQLLVQATGAIADISSGSDQSITAGLSGQAGGILLQGGTADGASAVIEAFGGTQTINVAGAVTMQGGTAPGPAIPDLSNPPPACGPVAACAAVRAYAGLQTIRADAISMTGGSDGTENLVTIRGDAGQDITIGSGGVTMHGGGGPGLRNFAIIESYGGDQILRFTAGAPLTLTGGTTGSKHFAGIGVIGAATSQQILGNPVITLTGGASGGGDGTGFFVTFKGNNAAIFTDPGTVASQVINAQSIDMEGGGGIDNNAHIGAWGAGASQTITVAGDVRMHGGTAAGTHADIISQGPQTITARSILLEGTAGGGPALIWNTSQAQTITTTGSGANGWGIELTNNGALGDVYINAGSSQQITASNGGGVLLDAVGGTVEMRANGAQSITIDGATSANALMVRGVAGRAEIHAQSQSIVAGSVGSGSITLQGGPANFAQAFVFTDAGTQNISTSGELRIIAGSAPDLGQAPLNCGLGGACALIGNVFEGSDPGSPIQTITAAGGISIVGGSTGAHNDTGIFSRGSQVIDAPGGITLQAGGEGPNNFATIAMDRAGYSQTVDFGAGGLTILSNVAGANGNFAEVYSSGTQTITGAGDILLEAGVSDGRSWAQIVGVNGQDISARSLTIVNNAGLGSTGLYTENGVQRITTSGGVGGVSSNFGLTLQNFGEIGTDQNGFPAAVYITNRNGQQIIDVVDSAGVRLLGNGGSAIINVGQLVPGIVDAQGISQNITVRGSGANAIVLDVATGQAEISSYSSSQSIAAGLPGESGSISILGGTSGTARARIIAETGTQTISTTGRVELIAGSAPDAGQAMYQCSIAGACAQILALQTGSGPGTPLQRITAGSIVIQGGAGGAYNSAELLSHGSQSVTITGAGGILIEGGTGTGNFARIGMEGGAGYSQTIEFGSGDLGVLGGAFGGRSHAEVHSSGNQSISGSGNITVAGGVPPGDGAPAKFYDPSNPAADASGFVFDPVVWSYGIVLGNTSGDPLGVQTITANSITIDALPSQSSTGIFALDGVQTISTTGAGPDGYGLTIHNSGAIGGPDQGGFSDPTAFVAIRYGRQVIDVANSGGLHIAGEGGWAGIWNGEIALIPPARGVAQSITVHGTGANAILLEGGSGQATIFGNFTDSPSASQTIVAGLPGESGSISIVGGTESKSGAWITAETGTQTIRTTGALTLVGGATASAAGTIDFGELDCLPACASVLAEDGQQTIDAGSIVLQGGASGNENLASIRSNAGQDITIHGAGGMQILGGGELDNDSAFSDFAMIENYGGAQSIWFETPGAPLTIRAGGKGMHHFAGIYNGGIDGGGQSIGGDPVISIEGGSGGSGTGNADRFQLTGNFAFIGSESGAQSVGATSIALHGGAADGNSADISNWGGDRPGSVAGSQTIDVTDDIAVIGGAANGAFARVYSHSGDQSISAGGALTIQTPGAGDAVVGSAFDSPAVTSGSQLTTLWLDQLQLDGGRVWGAQELRIQATTSTSITGGAIKVGAGNRGADGDITVDAGRILLFYGPTTASGNLVNAGTVNLLYSPLDVQSASNSGLITLYAGSGSEHATLQISGAGASLANLTGGVMASDKAYPTATTPNRIDVSGTGGVTNAGRIDAAHDLTIGGALTIPSTATGLVITGAGELTIEGAFTVNATGTQAVTIGGAGTLVTAGAADVNGGQTVLDRRGWRNSGDLTIGGRLTFDNGAVLTNEAGAALTLAGTNGTPLAAGAGALGVVSNAGTLTKTSAAVQTIQTALDNDGLINVDTDVLALAADGAHTGTFAVNDPGAELRFTGGTHTFTNSHFSGTGVLRVDGATLDIGTAMAVANPFVLQTGTLTGAGDLTLDGPFTLSGGTISGTGGFRTNAATTVNNATALLDSRTWNNAGAITINGRMNLDNGAVLTNLAGGTIETAAGSTNDRPLLWDGTGTLPALRNFGTVSKNATRDQRVNVELANAGKLNVNAAALRIDRFAGGTNDGTIDVEAGATLSTNGSSLANASGGMIGVTGTLDLGGGALTNAGALSVTGGDVTTTGTFTNTNTGTATLESGSLSVGEVDNSGTLDLISGTFTRSAGAAFRNSGSVHLNTGTLSLTANDVGASGGSYDVGSNGTLRFIGGSHSLGTLSGTGIREIDGGNVTASNVSLGLGGQLRVLSGALRSTGALTNEGSVVASGGALTAGSTTNEHSGNLTVSGANVSAGPLTNKGTVKLTSGVLSVGTVDNSGTLDLSSGTFTRSAGAAFHNSGSVHLNTGTLSLSANDVGASGGSYDVGPNGTLRFIGGSHSLGTLSGTGIREIDGGNVTAGSVSVAKGGQLRLLSGALSSTSALSNEGTVVASGGTLNAGSTRNEDGGSFTVNGATVTAGPFTNAGTVTLQAGSLSVGAVTNDGTLNLNGGTFTRTPHATFGNSRTVNLNKGTLSLDGGGTGGGIYNLASNTTLQFMGGQYEISSIAGAGSLEVQGTDIATKLYYQGGKMTIAVQKLTVTAGESSAEIDPPDVTLNVPGTITLAGGSQSGAFALIAGGNVTVEAGALNITGGAGSGSYAGIQAMTGTGSVKANKIQLVAGTGQSAGAWMSATGPLNVTTVSCNGCTLLSDDPLTSATSQAGLYGQPVTLTLPFVLEVPPSVMAGVQTAQGGGEGDAELKEEEDKDKDKSTDDTPAKEEPKNEKPLQACGM